MAHYPQSTAGLNYITYPVGPGASGTLLTGNASANAEGAYVQFVASSPFACNQVQVRAENGGGTAGRQFAFDLATGAGGAETVIVPNMLTDSNGNTSHTSQGLWNLPLAIPASTRIAMRVQVNSTTSNTLRCSLSLIAAGETPGPTSYVNYGYDATDSGGTSVDPGATPDTKGAYSQITASTSAIAQVLCLNVTSRANTAGASAFWAVDIATGAGGAETVLIPDLRFEYGQPGVADPTGMQLRTRTFLTYIAASTRLAVRASCDISDATDRLIDVAILAATAPAESTGIVHHVGGGLVQ
jgi:hypothetical protein